MLNLVLLNIGPIPLPIPLSPEFALLVLLATLSSAGILMVTRMVTGEQT